MLASSRYLARLRASPSIASNIPTRMPRCAAGAMSKPPPSSTTAPFSTSITTQEEQPPWETPQTSLNSFPGKPTFNCHRGHNPRRSLATLTNLSNLITKTPWRVTPDRIGLERAYVFASPALALDFATCVATLGRDRGHDPEWSGCGRVVYVRWTTHKPVGLSTHDIECARVCESQFALEGEVVGGGASFRAGEEGGYKQPGKEKEKEEGPKEQEKKEELWPEWRDMGMRGERSMRDYAQEEMPKLWEWVRSKALEEWCGGPDGGVWPAWSMTFGMACVTQTKWAVEVDQEGKVISVLGEPREPEDVMTMKEVTERTVLENDKVMSKLEGLLEEVVGQRR